MSTKPGEDHQTFYDLHLTRVSGTALEELLTGLDVNNYEWRAKCTPDFTLGYCVFVPRVKRLIAHPDAIDAVFLEEEPLLIDEYGDPVVILRHVITAVGGLTDEVNKLAPDSAKITKPTPELLCNYGAPEAIGSEKFLVGILDGQVHCP